MTETKQSLVGEAVQARAENWLRWRIMMLVGWRMMFHSKLKLVGTLMGVVFAVLLANQQAGTFLGLMAKNTMFIDHAGADIWIVPRETKTFQPGKPISTATLMVARAYAGQQWAEPLLYGGGSITLPGGGSEPLTIVGVRSPLWKGGPWNIVRGQVDVLSQQNTMIFEDSEREKIGGLNIGSVREVNGYRIIAGGFTWGLLPFGPSLAFADYDFARLLLKVDRDQTHFVIIGLKPGVNPDMACKWLQDRIPDAKVYTTAGFKSALLSYLFFKTPLGITYGSSTLFGLLVGFVIVSLSMFSSVVDHIREFGALKAIGATNGDLARILLTQSVTYAMIGTLLGINIVMRVADVIRSPKLAILIPSSFVFGSFLLMIVLCVAASSLALLRIRKVEPAMVFR